MSEISTTLRKGAAVLAALVTAALLSLTASADILEEARERGYIRVGFANEAPYGFATSAGELTGEAPEIAKYILNQLGIEEVDGVLTEFGSLIPGLKAGRFDLIAAGMFVTPKRCEQIDFSNPTYKIASALLVKEGNPSGIRNYESIAQNRNLKLAVLTGAVEKGYGRAAGVNDGQFLTLPDPPAMLKAVQSGRADAAALTTLSIANLVEKGEGVDMVGPIDKAGDQSVVGYGAFGFRPGDDKFREAFNAELAKLLGTKKHKELVWEHGFGRDFMLPDKTAAEICRG